MAEIARGNMSLDHKQIIPYTDWASFIYWWISADRFTHRGHLQLRFLMPPDARWCAPLESVKLHTVSRNLRRKMVLHCKSTNCQRKPPYLGKDLTRSNDRLTFRIKTRLWNIGKDKYVSENDMSVIKESKLQDQTVTTTGFGKVISNQFKIAVSELLIMSCFVGIFTFLNFTAVACPLS